MSGLCLVEQENDPTVKAVRKLCREMDEQIFAAIKSSTTTWRHRGRSFRLFGYHITIDVANIVKP